MNLQCVIGLGDHGDSYDIFRMQESSDSIVQVFCVFIDCSFLLEHFITFLLSFLWRTDFNRTVEVCSRSNIASSFRAISNILTRSHFALNVLLAGLYHPIQVGLAVLMVLTVDQSALWDEASS